MKRYLVLLFIIFISVLPVSYSQTPTVSINVLELPEIDFSNLMVSKNLSGVPNFFDITIHDIKVSYKLYCEITWVPLSQSSSPISLFKVHTNKPILPRIGGLNVIKNSDLGSGDLQITKDYQNDDQINKIIEKGKPIGTFIFKAWITYGTNFSNVSAISSVERIFRSYSQSISIMYPTQGLTLDPGNVLVSWIGIEGIGEKFGTDKSYYFIRVAERRNSTQSLEEALTPGNLIVDDQIITGDITSINLRSLKFNREWNLNKEIVLQVCAHIPGFGSGTMLKSQPVSFFLTNTNSTTNNSQTIVISNAIQSFFQTLPPSIVNSLLTGQMTIQEFVSETGARITSTEVQAALAYIQANPNSVLSVKFVPNTRSQD